MAETSGVAYIKLAQILATRADLLSEKSIADLKSINDSCNPIQFLEIKKILEVGYNEPLEKIFASIDETPVGSASISQVHKATLKTGETVAIKVKRTDVTKNINKDLRFLSRLLKFAKIFSKKLRYVYKSNIINTYFDWVRQEADFVLERKNIENLSNHIHAVNFRHSLANVKETIPLKVYPNLCTENIIVMEFVSHKTLNQLEYTEANKVRMKNAVESYLKLVFWSFFNMDSVYYHGDSHAGNLYLDDDGRLGFLDFGLVFKLEKSEITLIKSLGLTIYKKDLEKLEKLLLRISKKYAFRPKEAKKAAAFHSDLEFFLLKAEDIPATTWFIEIAKIFINHAQFAPTFLYEFAKALIIIDGLALSVGLPSPSNELLYDQLSIYAKTETLKQLKSGLFKNLSDLPYIVKSLID